MLAVRLLTDALKKRLGQAESSMVASTIPGIIFPHKMEENLIVICLATQYGHEYLKIEGVDRPVLGKINSGCYNFARF